jgi:hypothetical protein
MLPRDPAWRPRAAALLLATACFGAAAADKPCDGANKAIDGVTSWAALQKSVKDYGHCDKGTTADLFTEAMLRVVISGWQKVGDAGSILDKDEPFRRWLNKRLSSPTLATQDSAEIRDLAKSSCPTGQDKVCGDLLSAVELGRAISAPDLLLIPPPAPAAAKGKP